MIATPGTVRPPTWYRVASWLAVLWMLSGAAAFIMDLTTGEAALAQMSVTQRELYESRPAWLVAVYAIAVFSGLAGAVALVLRQRWAVQALAVSLIAVVIQFGFTLFGLRAIERVGAAEALPVPVFVFIAGALVFWVGVKARASRWI